MTEPPTITIQVRYFAILREHLGRAGESLIVPAGTAASAIYPMVTESQPRLAGLRRSIMLMVNEEYVRGDRVLEDGDELAFIPPVSGGEGDLARLFVVTEASLDPRAVEELVAGDGAGAGAIVTFTGTVRNNARGHDVIALDYEAYAPAAEKQLAKIGGEIAERWPSVRTAIHHRTGYLTPGAASVVIACAAPHRAEAFAAASWAIERIKEIVPIWKKEHYTDGSTWIGSEADYRAEARTS